MNIFKISSCLFLYLFWFTTVGAQNYKFIDKPADSASIGALMKYDGKMALQAVGNSFTQPLHWKGNDFLKMGGLFVSTFGLAFIDEQSSEYFIELEPKVPNVIKQFGWYFGSPQNYFMTTAGIYGFGLLTKNEKVRKTGTLIIAASFTTGLFQSITKYSVGRARPTANVGSTAFKPFTKDAAYHSFPSGHTILSVTLAHSIAKQFPNIWTKIGIYSLGSIAPFSRLLEGAHWLTDVTFSTVVSIIIVDGMDKFLFNRKSYNYPEKEKKISWNFQFSGNQIGVLGTF